MAVTIRFIKDDDEVTFLLASRGTERTTRQSRCHTKFLHVRGIQPGTVTPSNRA
jgi:hypothetical protein